MAGAGVGVGAAATGAGAGVDGSVERDTVLSDEAGTATIAEPIADTGTVFSVEAGVEPSFVKGVAAGAEPVVPFMPRDAPSPAASCSLPDASLS